MTTVTGTITMSNKANWLAAMSLAQREVVRFFRQRSRVIGAVATPLVFWLLIGSGLRGSFQMPGAEGDLNFLQYFFPGIVLLTVMFSSIYSAISTIDDRQAGFLQSVLVSPVPRFYLVLGKLIGGTVISVVQGVLLMLIGPLFGFTYSVVAFIVVVLLLCVVSLWLCALGFLFAWRIDSAQGYHAIMNLFLMPMWIVSGAFFPIASAHPVLRWVMYANPLTYGLAAIRHVLYFGNDAVRADLPPLWLCLLATAAVTALLLWLAAKAASKTRLS